MTTGSAVDGADQRLHLDGQRPATRPGQRHRGAGHLFAREEVSARVDLAQTPLAHLEPGGLAFGAEAILPRREHTKARARIAVERQDHVDRVLERPRARQVAVLGHVSGEQNRHVLRLRQPHQGIRAGPDLSDASRHRAGRGVAQGLDRIDRQQEGPGLPGGGDDLFQVAARRKGQLGAREPESAGPSPNLSV